MFQKFPPLKISNFPDQSACETVATGECLNGFRCPSLPAFSPLIEKSVSPVVSCPEKCVPWPFRPRGEKCENNRKKIQDNKSSGRAQESSKSWPNAANRKIEFVRLTGWPATSRR